MKNQTVQDMPAELENALHANGLQAFFDSCTPAHRREYIKWITEAKKPETRTKRAESAAALIKKRSEAESKK